MSQQAQFQLQQITGVLSNNQSQMTVGSIRSNVVTLVRIPYFVNGPLLPGNVGQTTQLIQLVSTGIPTTGALPAIGTALNSAAALCTTNSANQERQSTTTFVVPTSLQQQQQPRPSLPAPAPPPPHPPPQQQQQQYAQEQIDLRVRNVVSMFNVCCHVNLHKLAMLTPNVIYEQSRGVVMWQLRNPSCHARISACGKVIVTGAHSELSARRASRVVGRWIERKVNDRARFADYRVTNMMASCKLPFGLRLNELANDHPAECSYEPEITSGLVWRNRKPKMTLRIHSTGSVTITGATSEANVLSVMDSLYPVLLKYRIANCRQPDMPNTSLSSATTVLPSVTLDRQLMFVL